MSSIRCRLLKFTLSAFACLMPMVGLSQDSIAAMESPVPITYQGRLLQDPPFSGERTFRFQLLTISDDPEPVESVVWQSFVAESSDGSVLSVVDGYFAAIIGDADLTANLLATQGLRLRVWILDEADPPAFVRLGDDLPISPVPQAAYSLHAGYAASSGEAVSAQSADFASSAGHADTATSAASAGVAASAATANFATTAGFSDSVADGSITAAKLDSSLASEVGQIPNKAEISTVTSEVARLDGRIDSKANSETVITEVSRLDGRIDSKATSDSLTSEVTRLDGRIDTLASSVPSIDTKLDRLLALIDSSSSQPLAPELLTDAIIQVEFGQSLDYTVRFLYATHVAFSDGYSPPEGLTLNSSTGKLSWTPTASQVGRYEVSLSAKNPYTETEAQGELVVVVSPLDMVFVPAGTFWMGDAFGTGYANERPLHPVTISHPFFMDTFEVSREFYQFLRNQASTYGYSNLSASYVVSLELPANAVSWYSAVVWCNLRSEVEGLNPVYFADAALTVVLRDASAAQVFVDVSSNGYRLPTEAQWEYAARGGSLLGKYPWGNDDPVSFFLNRGGSTVDVRANYPRNGFGLSQMSGNVAEWVFDWFDASFYSKPAATEPDPVNLIPGTAGTKVARGGSYNDDSRLITVSGRKEVSPSVVNLGNGFRTIRPASSIYSDGEPSDEL